MKRTFTTASVVSLPTRRTTPSWMTRSSFAWIDFGISISSSRNSVPPLAVSSRPGLSRTAPVKAPLQWPNVSDSSNGSGSAEQFAARHLPHEPIDQRDIEGAPLQRFARLVAAPAQGDVVPLRLEHAEAAFAQRALVIHHGDPDARTGGRVYRGQRGRTTGRLGGECAHHVVSVVSRRRNTRIRTSIVVVILLQLLRRFTS